MDLIIKNGTVVTASEIMPADIGVKDGKIAAIAAAIDGGRRGNCVSPPSSTSLR